MFHQPPACLDQPLLEARQGPVPNPLRQNQSPPQIPQVIRRRVREILTWSGVGSSSPTCRNCRRLNESATRPAIPRSLSIPSKNPIRIRRNYIPGTSDGRPSFSW